MHTADSVVRPETIVHLNAAQRDVGRASCGADPLPRYRLNRSRYGFRYEVTAGIRRGQI